MNQLNVNMIYDTMYNIMYNIMYGIMYGINLTGISKARSIKRQSLNEYLPAPYYDLTC